MNKRTRLRRHPERSAQGETADILAEGIVAHVGFMEEGQPYVVPMTYHFDSNDPERLYLHGSVKSRAMRHLEDGDPVCVTVTLADGLVYSRKAMNHSMNYRSAMVFGRGRPVQDDAEKLQVFDEMVQRYFPGRKV